MLYRNLGRTGVSIPVIGQGTWKFGENKLNEQEEIKALRFGITKGMNLIDTAEDYANGGSERVIGQAIEGIRKEVFLVTKVSKKNCSYKGVLQAAETSLGRLKTDYIDLYLQHWPSEQFEVAETMEAMAELYRQGLIKYVGVSNFSLELMQEAQKWLGDIPLACNQVPFHLNDRLIENKIMPFCESEGITVVGYSPFGYAPNVYGMPGFPEIGTDKRVILEELGTKYGKTAYQVALNWILSHEGIVTIPKAAKIDHIIDNIHAVGWKLLKSDIERININFPKQLI